MHARSHRAESSGQLFVRAFFSPRRAWILLLQKVVFVVSEMQRHSDLGGAGPPERAASCEVSGRVSRLVLFRGRSAWKQAGMPERAI